VDGPGAAPAAGRSDPTGPSNLGNDPHLQWSLRSTQSIGERLDPGIAVRHVDRLPTPVIPAYTATDLSLNWRGGADLLLSLDLSGDGAERRRPARLS